MRIGLPVAVGVAGAVVGLVAAGLSLPRLTLKATMTATTTAMHTATMAASCNQERPSLPEKPPVASGSSNGQYLEPAPPSVAGSLPALVAGPWLPVAEEGSG